MELALALVRDSNPWFALAFTGFCISLALVLMSRRWARANEHDSERDHQRKQFELETERTVKTQRLSEHPALDNGKPMVEHRSSDKRRTEKDYG